MEFGKAFTYPFEDQDWLRKLAIPALISLIPIIGQIFVMGWMLEVIRRVVRRDAVVLPEIDFGTQLVDGLKMFVVTLVFTIPVYIINAPTWIGTALAGDSEEIMTAVAFLSICCGGLGVIYGLAMAFFLPAAITNMVVKGNIGAAFQFGEIFGLIKAAPGAYLMVFLGILLAVGIIMPLGAIACGIGVLFTYVYAMAISGHLYGQAYLEANKNRGMSY